MNEAMFKEARSQCEGFRRRFVAERCTTAGDLTYLASALAYQAEVVWKNIGSVGYAAEQFYAIADRLAGEQDAVDLSIKEV